VVTKDTLAHKEVQVARADLEGKIDYLRSLLMNPQIPLNMGPLEANTLKPKDSQRAAMFNMFINPLLAASERLYNLLIKPVEAELSNFTILGIIPNGKLHLLPFQALGKKKPEGGFRFMVEEKSLFHLNSQSILKFAQKRAEEIGQKGKLLAFGNPDNSLKYAEKEIQEIKSVFSETKAYVKENASEDKVKSGLKGFNILHLATHGKMKGHIKKSYILFAQSADKKEDGRLFLREIWGLSLRGYQLVTLSACETAKGKEASGDIIVSLQTAFLRAGTPTILATLWEVDDQATGFFMKTFYANLIRHEKAKALRIAQLALLKEPRYVYPYYWAPFILAGDWR
jgi:CHAT domain-containing protein